MVPKMLHHLLLPNWTGSRSFEEQMKPFTLSTAELFPVQLRKLKADQGFVSLRHEVHGVGLSTVGELRMVMPDLTRASACNPAIFS